MKNPFVQAAMFAALVAAAIRDNALFDFRRKSGGQSFGAGNLNASRTRQHGPRNPAGSKLVRGFYRNKFGVKDSYGVSRDWYGSFRP